MSVRGELARVRRERIIELLTLGKLTHRQIAERLGCSIAVVEKTGQRHREAQRKDEKP
jgi:DNA-directed RNA polymerase specialized sigma24 family protein